MSIHYQILRDSTVQPIRLEWSSELQQAADASLAAQKLEAAERRRKQALPMQSMREWAKKRGLLL